MARVGKKLFEVVARGGVARAAKVEGRLSGDWPRLLLSEASPSLRPGSVNAGVYDESCLVDESPKEKG